jgi:hypothetical protein
MEAVEHIGSGTESGIRLYEITRETDGLKSKKVQYFLLTVRGEILEGYKGFTGTEENIVGYYVDYDVVAKSTKHVLRFVQEFEHFSPPGRKLWIEELSVLEKRPEYSGYFMRVYERQGRIFFGDEDND